MSLQTCHLRHRSFKYTEFQITATIYNYTIVFIITTHNGSRRWKFNIRLRIWKGFHSICLNNISNVAEHTFYSQNMYWYVKLFFFMKYDTVKSDFAAKNWINFLIDYFTIIHCCVLSIEIEFLFQKISFNKFIHSSLWYWIFSI